MNTHAKNKWIITAMMAIFIFALSLLFFGCNAAKIDRQTKQTEEVAEKTTAEETVINTKTFDFSTHAQEDFRFSLLPLDPSREMGVKSNPDTGEKTYTNAVAIFENKKQQTNTNITKETAQNQTNTTTEASKATTNETTKTKLKFSVSWYALLILCFFGLLNTIVLFFLFRISNRLKSFSI